MRTPALLEAVREDFVRVLAAAGLPADAVTLEREPARGGVHEVELLPSPGGARMVVRAADEEWGPAAYLGLERLGFLFPHPRRQLSPALEELRRRAAGRHEWRPRLARRGFHLHTQHHGEWTEGFFGSAPEQALDAVRWLARNRQNVLQLMALKTVPDLAARLAAPFALARGLGIATGLSVSFASIQQKSLRLLDWPLPVLPLAALLPGISSRRAAERADALAAAIPFDYLFLELGSSEFTPTPRETTLGWIEAVRAALAARGRAVFVKVHASSHQGDYNFLPRHSAPDVGVQPHTIMFYGLDDRAPVYGRSDFADMKAFMLEESRRRPTWYFPETSYFVAVDIDVPLLLTDYLRARAADMDLLAREGIPGQANFTTGQELGCWLLDWTVALMAGEDAATPWAGLDRLGEDRAAWGPILDYQTRFIKEAGLLPALSSANFMDELPGVGPRRRVLARRLLTELARDPAALSDETAALERAAAAVPPTGGVKDEELRLMLEVTFARVRHALALRRALARPLGSGEREAVLADAAAIRLAARAKVEAVAARHSRYAGVFEYGPNLTSYRFGYGWPAKTLFFWEREEGIVRRGRGGAFYKNLYPPRDFLL